MGDGNRQAARGPSGLRLGLGLAAVVAAACGSMCLFRGDARAVHDRESVEYAALCPRWARLAEELLSFEGGVSERCELLSVHGALRDASYVYKAAPNIEVAVSIKSDGLMAAAQRVLESVHIRDIRNQASVTYNAEALAMLK